MILRKLLVWPCSLGCLRSVHPQVGGPTSRPVGWLLRTEWPHSGVGLWALSSHKHHTQPRIKRFILVCMLSVVCSLCRQLASRLKAENPYLFSLHRKALGFKKDTITPESKHAFKGGNDCCMEKPNPLASRVVKWFCTWDFVDWKMTGSIHTCFSHKHLLWWAGWPLAHSIVYTHANLIALVFT